MTHTTNKLRIQWKSLKEKEKRIKKVATAKKEIKDTIIIIEIKKREREKLAVWHSEKTIKRGRKKESIPDNKNSQWKDYCYIISLSTMILCPNENRLE